MLFMDAPKIGLGLVLAVTPSIIPNFRSIRQMGRWRALENGKRRTENGARGKRATDGAVGQRWSVFRETRRTQRTTKKHKARRSLEHRGTQRVTQRNTGMDCQFVFKSQRTQRTRRKATLGRAVRARKAHVRPGGLKGHGGLRTPCFGFLGVLRRSSVL